MQSVFNSMNANIKKILVFVSIIFLTLTGNILLFWLSNISLKYTYLIFATALTTFLIIILFRQKDQLKDSSEITKQLKSQQDRHQRELEMARHIQQSLLTRRTLITKELKIVANSRPAENIGGDFYTISEKNVYETNSNEPQQKGIIQLTNRSSRVVNICIGDVAGHGVASALIMLLTQSIMDRLLLKNNSPAKTLEMANKKIKSHTENSEISFVTSSILQFNLDNNMMTYSKAGHTDSILLRNDGSISTLSTDGVFLGMFEQPKFEEKQIQLKPKDRIICYTDGITEAKSPDGELYGLQRFQDFLKKHYQLPLEELISATYKEIERYSESPDVSDDSTLVLIEVL